MCAVQSARIKAAANELIQLVQSHSIQTAGCDNCAVIEHHSFYTAPEPTPPSLATTRRTLTAAAGSIRFNTKKLRGSVTQINEGKKSPVYLASRIYNHLQKNITEQETHILKRKLKNFLLEKNYCSTGKYLNHGPNVYLKLIPWHFCASNGISTSIVKL